MNVLYTQETGGWALNGGIMCRNDRVLLQRAITQFLLVFNNRILCLIVS
jgi:hypothetical protein